jgi:hypothetical protein
VNGAVNLRWTAPRLGRGTQITDYVIQYTSDGGLSWSTYADAVTSRTSATVIGLPAGLEYRFRVAAVANDILGVFSTSTKGFLPYDRSAAPAAPSAVRVSGGTASANVFSLVSSRSSSTYTVSWNAVAGNAGGPVSDYVIQYRAGGSSRWVTYNDGTKTATSATIKGLRGSSGYLFRVAAKNKAGIGAYSTEASIGG